MTCDRCNHPDDAKEHLPKMEKDFGFLSKERGVIDGVGVI